MSEQVEKGEWPTEKLPNSWAWADFDEIFDDRTDSRRKLPKRDYKPAGLYPVIDQGEELIGGYSDDERIVSEANTPCIVWGDHTRCVKFVDCRFIQGADGVKVLEPTAAIDAGFSLRAMQAVKLPDKGYSRHFKFLRSTRFPLPPLSEQRQIVDKLDSLFVRTKAAREELDHVPPLIEHYKQAILEKAFTGELTANWRVSRGNIDTTDLLSRILSSRRILWQDNETRLAGVSGRSRNANYAEPRDLPIPSSLNELPSGWKWLPIDTLAWKVVDGVHKTPDYVREGVPFVTVRNLTAGPGIDLTNLKYVSGEDHSQFCKRANPERDDILISKDGTLGVVRRISEEPNFSIFVSVALVKPALREMSKYLEWALQAPQVQEQMIGVGTGLQHIHLTDLKQDFIPVAPMDEQEEIVRRIEAAMEWLDMVAEEQQKAAHLLDRLEGALLDKAFRGDLVSQDPNDEPADQLLKRIRVERASHPKTRRARGSGAAA